MPSSSALTSKIMSDSRQRKRNAFLNDMTFHSEKQNNFTEDSHTFSVYNRLVSEREQAKEQEKQRIKTQREQMMQSMIAERRGGNSNEDTNRSMSKAELIAPNKNSSVVEEESLVLDGDEGSPDLGAFFEDEKPPEPLVASDGKIIFSHNSKFIKYWNNTVILLAMYNSVTIPMAIFYGDQGPSFIQSETIAICDALVDFIFLIDIIITFRTTYLNTDLGCEETNTHKIAITYLRGSFTVDLASSVPFANLVPAGAENLKSILNLLGLLKLLRIQRLSAAVTSSNLPQGTKVQLKILMMAFELLVVMHVLGTIWFFLVSQS